MDSPFFDGTFKGYPKFQRRWHTFQSIQYNLTPQRELVHLFRDNCMDKKVADRIRSEETMGECWRLLDSFYNRPAQFAQNLLNDASSFKKMLSTEYEKLREYYVLLRTNGGECIL
jgi:hypothetical protein